VPAPLLCAVSGVLSACGEGRGDASALGGKGCVFAGISRRMRVPGDGRIFRYVTFG